MSLYSPSQMRYSYLKNTLQKSNISEIYLPMNYSLIEVEIAENPVGDEKEDWCRYVLVRGASKITGYHRGTVMETTNYANGYLAQINSRNQYNKSKYPITKSK